ncbi:MAG: VPS10 domain-containing protein [Anaerolineales bacterium]
MVLSGTEILSQPTVLLDGAPLFDVGWVSSSTLTSTIPAGYPVAIYDVTVQSPDGVSDTLLSALTVRHPTPNVTAFDPVSGTFGQPLTLVITGTDFVSPTTVLLDYTTLDAHYVSSTSLTATVPSALAPGVYDLTVSNPGPGSVSDFIADAFTLYSPVPTVSEVEPQKTYNDMDTSIVISGTNFAPTPQVVLGSTPLVSVTWISLTQLTAEVPWGMEPGTYPLTVTNPTPGGYAVQFSEALTMAEGFNTWTTGGPYGGHIQEVVPHPLISTTVYALATNVGIFASTDAGASWEMIHRNDWMTRISFDATDPQVIYIGGDGGLRRTMDGGASWEEIEPRLGEWTQAWNLYRPLGHPTEHCVVYAGKRTPDEPEMEPGGVYWSGDCGSNWEKWGDESTGLTDTHVIDLAFHPDNPDIMVAGTQTGNVFRSDDAGASWSWQGRVEPRIERIMLNPFGDHEAWIQTRPTQGLSGPPYVYTSTNLTDWTPVTVTEGGGSTATVTDLAFPAPDTIWAATGYGVVSTDGGATWTETQGWAPVLDVDGVVSYGVDPDAPNVLYGGHSLGGVSKSTDGGATWQQSSEGLAGVMPYALAIAPDDPETLYAYTTRGMLKSQNGGRSWQSLEKWIGGQTGKHMLAVDPFVANRLYLGQPCDDAFCLWIGENGGETWRQVTGTVPSTYRGYRTGIGVLSPHPTEAGRIFAGVGFFPDSLADSPVAGGIFVSENYGEAWSFIEASEPLSSVEEIVYDAGNPNQIYAGGAGQGLWKSTSSGATWEQLTVPGLAPPIGIESLAAHPDRSGVLLARLMSFAETENPNGLLYISQDAGGTWTQLDEGTSDGGLFFAPTVPDMSPYLLYTGCGASPCRSLDVGRSWNAIYGVPAPYVMASATDGERIVVYAASPGGMAAAEQAALSGVGLMGDIPGRGSVMGSGVYRTTLRPLDQHVYLPLVLRQ